MTWTKLDDCFPDHPKIIGLSDAAFRLHVEGMCYANRLETDGRIPKTASFVLARRKALRELLGGVWDDADTHYMIHDFLEYNPSRTELQQRRKDTAERVGNWRGNSVGNARRNGVTNTAPVPSRPVPIDPDPSMNPPNPPKGGHKRRSAAQRNDPITSPAIRARIDAIEGRSA